MSQTYFIIAYVIFILYVTVMVFITIYCLHQLQLLWLYFRALPKLQAAPPTPITWPNVTVQLPVYNELHVVERLIDRVVQLHYPPQLLEIQVLDDSTDQTQDLIAAKVNYYQARGVNILQVRRENRQGFKAGALQAGLHLAQGEFIAIFDADFLPHPDFLERTIPYFADPGIGVVQTRWEHLNEQYSLLTRLQAFPLNVHFTVEQSGRQNGRHFLQFNGTAGVWRKSTIEASGGWQGDTLTEDLDLSYRAQLKGWRIHYLEAVGSPAELPVEMYGLKSQQNRWMKGGAETARKMLPLIWKSTFPWRQKFYSTLHLLASSVFLFVFLLSVLSVPVLLLLRPLGINTHYWSIFLMGMLSIIAVYYTANEVTSWHLQPWWKRLVNFISLFPLFLAMSMGLAMHNAVAVVQGWSGRKSSFVRTPKFAIEGREKKSLPTDYLRGRLNGVVLWEGLLAVYFFAAVIIGLKQGLTSFLYFHILLTLGYGAIFYYSVLHLKLRS